jgi:hypothetical protein
MYFRDPVDLLMECREEQASIPTTSFITDPEHRPRQEKWCAAMFGAGYSKYVDPCRVAVNESRNQMDVDFFLKARGSVFPFQTTECLMEGRRRDEEYRKLGEVERGIESEPERVAEFLSTVLAPYKPALGSEKGPEWIEATIARKVKKRYDRSEELNLLVYANFTAMGLEPDALRERARTHRDIFASIWIITDCHICTLFSNELIGEVPEGKWGEL